MLWLWYYIVLIFVYSRKPSAIVQLYSMYQSIMYRLSITEVSVVCSATVPACTCDCIIYILCIKIILLFVMLHYLYSYLISWSVMLIILYLYYLTLAQYPYPHHLQCIWFYSSWFIVVIIHQDDDTVIVGVYLLHLSITNVFLVSSEYISVHHSLGHTWQKEIYNMVSNTVLLLIV